MYKMHIESRLTKDSDNILFIFESSKGRRMFQSLKPLKTCLLVVESGLPDCLVGMRYCMYKYMSDDEVYELVEKYKREIDNEK